MDEATAEPPEADSTPATAPVTPVATLVDAEAGVCAVELPEFEGPLDLLLHLVRRHELDILDIPIAFVTEKYLEYIEFMRAMDLEVAGDYLVMAATLAYLKSRELVPSDPLDEIEEGMIEDGPDPREELVSRLLEYQKYRDAADQLDALPISGRDTFGRGQQVDLPPVDAGLAPITLFRLAEAYHRVLEKARILKSHEVVFEKVSVSSRMQQLTVLLLERETFEFEQIFLEREWTSEAELRGMLVVTLMSILELVRLGIARVHQPLGTTALVVQRQATAEEAKVALSGYDEAASFGHKPEEAETSGEDGAAEDELAEDELAEDELAEDELAELLMAEGATATGAMGEGEPSEAELAEVELAEDERGEFEVGEGEPTEVEMAEVEMAEDEMAEDELGRDEEVPFGAVAPDPAPLASEPTMTQDGGDLPATESPAADDDPSTDG